MSDEKVLYKCPECRKSYRVPVESSKAVMCRPCQTKQLKEEADQIREAEIALDNDAKSQVEAEKSKLAADVRDGKACGRCHRQKKLFELFWEVPGKPFLLCKSCAEPLQEAIEKAKVEIEKAKVEADAQRENDFLNKHKAVLLTSTPTLQGYQIVEYKGVDGVEITTATGLFSEIVTEIQDNFGFRSGMYSSKLRKARLDAMSLLRTLAVQLGCNAVVGIDIDYSTFSSNRTAIIVNGTFVNVEPLDGNH